MSSLAYARLSTPTMTKTPENLRLSIDAPGADRAATTAALQAAEEQLAVRGITLTDCYTALTDSRIARPLARLALDAAGMAARSALQDHGAPEPAGPCLVLVARE